MAEAAVKGYSAEVWYGVFSPKGTPPDVVTALHRAIVQASASGAFRDRLALEGVVGGIGSPQDLRAVAEQEVGR